MLAFSRDWKNPKCPAVGGDQHCSDAHRQVWGCEGLLPAERAFHVGPMKMRICPNRIIAQHKGAVDLAQEVAILGKQLAWAVPNPTLRVVKAAQAINRVRMHERAEAAKKLEK